MSGVYPSSHSVGVLQLRLSIARWFWISHVYSSASSHVLGFAPVVFITLLNCVLVSFHPCSAKF
jgi:hypothetical protein